MRSFVKIKFSQNVDIKLSLTGAVYSCSSREFEAWQICILTQFAKIKFSRKFLNLQYKSSEAFSKHFVAADISFFLLRWDFCLEVVSIIESECD